MYCTCGSSCAKSIPPHFSWLWTKTCDKLTHLRGGSSDSGLEVSASSIAPTRCRHRLLFKLCQAQGQTLDLFFLQLVLFCLLFDRFCLDLVQDLCILQFGYSSCKFSFKFVNFRLSGLGSEPYFWIPLMSHHHDYHRVFMSCEGHAS